MPKSLEGIFSCDYHYNCVLQSGYSVTLTNFLALHIDQESICFSGVQLELGKCSKTNKKHFNISYCQETSLQRCLGIYASPKMGVSTLFSWPKAMYSFLAISNFSASTERRFEREKGILSQAWWHISLIPVCLCGFEAAWSIKQVPGQLGMLHRETPS